MSLERKLQLPSDPSKLSTLLQSSSPNSPLHKSIEIGNVKYNQALEYAKGSPDPDSGAIEVENVFDAGMPGAMSIEELESKVDLGSWGVRLRDGIFQLKVRTDSQW